MILILVRRKKKQQKTDLIYKVDDYIWGDSGVLDCLRRACFMNDCQYFLRI